MRPVHIEPTAGEGPAETDGSGVLADIDEAAGTDDLVSEPAYIDVAMLIDLGKGQKGKLQPATVVEIELVRLIDHCLIVTRGASLVTGRRRSTNQPLFVREYA